MSEKRGRASIYSAFCSAAETQVPRRSAPCPVSIVPMWDARTVLPANPGPISRPETCSDLLWLKARAPVMSRLTFHIDPDAALVGAIPVSPWASLRAKLFGADTGPVQLSVRLAAINRQTAARRFSSTPLPPALSITRPLPAKAADPWISAGPQTLETPLQVAYKGRLIRASQLEDGSWIATYSSLDPLPLGDAPRTHRFMARILAIASVEIEIDDLEQPLNGTNRA